MARLGVLLLLVVALMTDAASLWSGGVEWGTATTPRANAYWQPGTAVPTGRPFPDVAIGGELVTAQGMSASWSLGISDYLADLSPNTASVTFAGTLVAAPGDDFIISTPLGAAWAGRVDTVVKTRDVNGDYWTTVNGTDRVGALGAATLEAWSYSGTLTLETLGEDLASDAGISLDIIDGSVDGLENLYAGPAAYDGTVLDIINKAARSSNAMLGLTRDGRISAVVREAVTPSSVLTLTGDNAPVSWAESTSVDGVINKLWVWDDPVASPRLVGYDTSGSITAYGERTFEGADFATDQTPANNWTDWNIYINGTLSVYPSGTPPLPIADAELIVSSWSQEDLILLDPFQWVTESGTNWQVMSVQHDVTPNEWRVRISADRLLDVLVDIS